MMLASSTMDEPYRLNMSNYEQKVKLERPGCGVTNPCNFVQLPNAYSSVWLLSREQSAALHDHALLEVCATSECTPSQA